MAQHKHGIRKVAVLGSGVMGSRIAAHCINAGLDVWLLDLKSDDPKRPNKLVEEHIKELTKTSPEPLFDASLARHIKPGNFEDDLEVLSEVDWIVEVVVERLDIKKNLMRKVETVRKPGTIVSSNTSGIPIRKIGEECSEEFQSHFLGTHFFNPPRYMKLLEVIPTELTSSEVIEFVTGFCQKTLGKGVVHCKDTPNFIANRIGVFSIASIVPYFFNKQLRAETIDVLTGTLTGYSKAATFRTADMAGLDVLKHVADNLYPAVPDDEKREVFKLPGTFGEMVEHGLIGNKAGKGFYTKEKGDKGKTYYVVDPETLEYEKQQPVTYETIENAKNAGKSSALRLRFLVEQDDEVGRFVWQIQKELMLYAANRIPEIADSVEEVDRAMQWGFNWELGPFQRWDAIGVRYAAERIENEGETVPDSIKKMLKDGREQFYDYDARTVYNLATGQVESLTSPAQGAITVAHQKSEAKEVLGNQSAGLLDIGDGVALFEFRSRTNTLSSELIDTLFTSLDRVGKDFDALVIGHDGNNFSVGADLKEMGPSIQKGHYDKVMEAVKNFQSAVLGIKYAPFPVVVAPFNQTLGGGTEFMLHADKVVAHHELYAGLVEAGVGLLPAGGGTKEMVRRYLDRVVDSDNADEIPYLKEVFKLIGMAKVSMGAVRARQMGLLRDQDAVVMNRDLLIRSAKSYAQTLSETGYQPPREPQVKLLGKSGYGAIKTMLYNLKEGRFITPYDFIIGDKVAEVMTGGNLSEPQWVPESYVMRLEREAFVDLVKDQRTIDRIEHMLTKGKPLRN